MIKYQIGEQVCNPSPDGVTFDILEDGAVLLVKMAKPTSSEKNNFRSGVPQFKFAIVDNIIFLLVRFGVGPWMEAPFYRHISKGVDLPEISHDGIGIALHAMLIDASTGILVHQKLIGMEHNLSVKLIEAIGAQPVIPDYNFKLSKVFAEKTTEDILAEAQNC